MRRRGDAPMNIEEILTGGGVVLVLLTLVQITPLKLNPWSVVSRGLKKLASSIGSAMNGGILEKMNELEGKIESIDKKLESHERSSEKSKADEKRASILRFNRELLRDLPYTMEDFIEVLSYIDFYESYCTDHPEYENNRAVMAIQNIKDSYRKHLEKHDFSVNKKGAT